MDTEDLWGTLPKIEKGRTPVSILKEQANLLMQKTERVIEARVVTQANIQGAIIATLVLFVPALSGYQTSLLVIQHGIGLYPVTLLPTLGGSAQVVANNEVEYIDMLRKIFQSEMVQGVLVNLLTQVKSMA
jgi:hypothetical protein